MTCSVRCQRRSFAVGIGLAGQISRGIGRADQPIVALVDRNVMIGVSRLARQLPIDDDRRVSQIRAGWMLGVA